MTQHSDQYVGLDDFMHHGPERPLNPVPASGDDVDEEGGHRQVDVAEHSVGERESSLGPPIGPTPEGDAIPAVNRPQEGLEGHAEGEAGRADPASAARSGAAHRGAPETAETLTRERLLPRRSRVPEGGWRLVLYKGSFGLVNVGDSSDVLERHSLEARVAARVVGETRSVAVLTRKGGVGKTTTSMLLGKTMAQLRHDRTVAIDANPDAGTLIERTERQTSATVWDVVESRESVGSFADMSRLVSRDATRLDVIASESDPHRARAFGATEYDQTMDLLSQYYSITVTDTGTDFTHEVLAAVLKHADTIVVVAGTKMDEAKLASQTLDIVEAYGYADLAHRAIVALVETTSSKVDVDEIERHFETKASQVVRIPRDSHIAEGSAIELGRLHRSTRRAGLKLAAAVVDQLTGRTQ